MDAVFVDAGAAGDREEDVETFCRFKDGGG
jgi:hypothetical protein